MRRLLVGTRVDQLLEGKLWRLLVRKVVELVAEADLVAHLLADIGVEQVLGRVVDRVGGAAGTIIFDLIKRLL